jgi:hypothetical protein
LNIIISTDNLVSVDGNRREEVMRRSSPLAVTIKSSEDRSAAKTSQSKHGRQEVDEVRE